MPPSQFDISWDELRTLSVLVPPLATQRAIADRLDRETARIDALIAARRRMTELLEERREARISALLWAGAPSLVRLKHLARPPTSGNRDHSSFTLSDGGVACLRGLNVRPGLIDRANLLRISPADHLRHGGTRLRHGDLVIVRSGLAGSAAVVPQDLDDCNCVDLVIVRRSPRILPTYLEYVVNSREARDQVEQRSVGALLTHFNAVDVADLLIPLRTIASQREIVRELEALDGEFEQMRSVIARQTNLLQERRQALITAAVTGQLDIPEAE
jgi:type I restriction enzyme S subunit